MSTTLKKLTKNGNSFAVIIERPVLDVLGARPDFFVKRTIEGKKLILEFVSPQEGQAIMDEASDEIMRTHKESFKKLAK